MTSAITLSRVAALCLLAGAAHASPVHVSTAAADALVPVPPTVYTPAARYQSAAPAVPDTASPDRAWREQNRIVAAQNSMMLTMGGQAQGADPHAGHAGHAGHAPAAAADPHAGHPMAGAGSMSATAKPCCAGEGCCCKDSAGEDACCGKDLAGAPPSCAPAKPAPAPASSGAPSGGHQHGARP